MWLCGLVALVGNYMLIRNKSLSQIKFTELYEFLIAIALIVYASYLISKNKKQN